MGIVPKSNFSERKKTGKHVPGACPEHALDEPGSTSDLVTLQCFQKPGFTEDTGNLGKRLTVRLALHGLLDCRTY